MQGRALVVGASGITGGHTARELIRGGWQVYGLSRSAADMGDGVIPVAANLLDATSVEVALETIAPTHVFFTTWTRRATEAENIAANSAMVRHVLDALAPKRSIRHVDLVTGLKHYLGPFDAYVSSGLKPETPLREEQPRLDLPNFYYAQEDAVFAAAARDGFTWTIQRPHTVIGKAVGNAMNMGTTLAVYASICMETGRPFRWPGSRAQWEGLSDVTDARVLAKHLVWATGSIAAQNEAFNVVNGDYFRWSWLWPRLAAWFGVEWAGFDGEIHPLEAELADGAEIWERIATRHKLKEARFDRLASPWHTDLDLSRPLEVMTDMSKSRRAGFTVFQTTELSFTDLFAQLRSDGLIP